MICSQIQRLALAIPLPILEQIIVKLLSSLLVFVVVFVVLSNQYYLIDFREKEWILKLLEMVDGLVEGVTDAAVALLFALAE